MPPCALFPGPPVVWPNTSIERTSQGRFAPFGPPLMSNIRRLRIAMVS